MIRTFARLPLAVRTVMVALPRRRAVTTPLPSTAATRLAEVFQVRTVRAVSGARVAPNTSVSPTFIVTVPVALRATPVGAKGSTTTTFTLALLPLALAVMVALPAARAVTRPEAVTPATFLRLVF